MKRVKLKNDELAYEIIRRTKEFPKYTTQLMNLANRNAQGTRPKIVGQMTELIQEFKGKKYAEWESWYFEKKPQAIDWASDLVFDMILKLKDAIEKIDQDMVREWVEDLVLANTFLGLRFQEVILMKIASEQHAEYRLATPDVESRGIDSYIGERPISIKPITY